MEEIKIKQIPAKALVKVTTDFGKWCLWEIKGLKEGTVLDGMYNPRNKAFDFTFKGQDAMLWIGQNGELVSLGEDQPHKYMMLNRLLLDCKYFIKQHPSARILYYPDIARHMFEMRTLWNNLNIKPKWLSYKQIGKLEHKMNQELTKANRNNKKNHNNHGNKINKKD